jgi:3D-(3,5/4)-trihydroxycyclohexane-1,2-dione acylhydrolase (decyclizing)
VIAVEVDPAVEVPGYESWWDVAVAEVSERTTVRAGRERYEAARRHERSHV